MSSFPSIIPHAVLAGHSSSVLCLALPPSDTHDLNDAVTGDKSNISSVTASPTTATALLLSGSEDGTARLWDRTINKSIRCFKPTVTTSATSTAASSSALPTAITSVAFHPLHSSLIYLAAGRRIHYYDWRQKQEIILRQPDASWKYNTDEINSLQLNSSGTFLSAADDDGEIKIVDLQEGKEGKLFKTLKGHHTSMCTSAIFRPHTTFELWSGGMDCQLLQWDFSSGRMVQSFSTQPTAATTSSNQTLNPPFVNSMTFTTDGHHLLVGSGNAEILLFDARLKKEQRRVMGHTHSVMHVGLCTLPPAFSSLSSFTSSTCLISGGNDQSLLLWDIQAILDAQTKASSVTSSTPPASSASANKNRKKREKAKAKKKAATDSNTTTATANDDEEAEAQTENTNITAATATLANTSLASDASSPRMHKFTGDLVSSSSLPPSLPFSSLEASALDVEFIRYRWKHHSKMNAIVTTADPPPNLSNSSSSTTPTSSSITDGLTVYVADTTNNITAYLIR